MDFKNDCIQTKLGIASLLMYFIPLKKSNMGTNSNYPKLLFKEKALPYILEAFGKTINENGFITELSSNEIVLTPEGEELTSENFAGIKKGSEILIKDDLYSMIKLAEGKY